MLFSAVSALPCISQENRFLIDHLVQKNILTLDQAEVVLIEHSSSQRSVESILIDIEFVSEEELSKALSVLRGYTFISLENKTFSFEYAKIIPYEISFKSLAIAIHFDEKTQKLTVAMSDPADLKSCDRIRFFLKDIKAIHFVSVKKSEVLNWLSLYHAHLYPSKEEYGALALEHPQLSDLFLEILAKALVLEASDIHFHPEKIFIYVRFRIDGFLRTLRLLHQNVWSPLCVQLKVLCEMDITESRRPQDGRFGLHVMGRPIDFRVSSHPTSYGESLVIRILDPRKKILSLENLGYSLQQQKLLKKLLDYPQGLLMVSGPTGSGKTTSLYALLSLLDLEKTNLMTLEEPIEYKISGVRQSEMKEGSLMSFAEGIRSILRQDPDTLFIGEIRDADTAQMSLRAAMTGHKVFSTIHTYDALSTIDRFIDFNVSTSLLSGLLHAVISQRLVRKLCSFCKSSIKNHDMHQCQDVIYKAVGCEKCHFQGYKGRQVLAEIMVFDATMKEMILKGKTSYDILKYYKSKGGKTLKDEAIELIGSGVTSKEEIQRAAGIF